MYNRSPIPGKDLKALNTFKQTVSQQSPHSQHTLLLKQTLQDGMFLMRMVGHMRGVGGVCVRTAWRCFYALKDACSVLNGWMDGWRESADALEEPFALIIA
jgi:hypothetical protein